MIPDGVQVASVTSFDPRDDLSREVYCILGIPVDAIGMHAALRRIESAAESKVPFLVSTSESQLPSKQSIGSGL